MVFNKDIVNCVENNETKMDKKLELKTQLLLEDVRRFTFHTVFKRAGWMLLFIGAMMWIAVLLYFLGLGVEEFPVAQLGLAVGATIVLPGFLYFGTAKSYNSNNRFKEPVYYTIDETWIEMRGSSFETKLTWDKMHSVKETKSWFLIYSNKHLANIIPKRDLTLEETRELRTIIKSVSNLKSSLMEA